MELALSMLAAIADRGTSLAAAAPDEALVAAFRAGDGAAFERLVRRHQRAVIAVAIRVVKEPSAAEDLAQRAFVRAMEGLHAFRGEASFRSWVLRIVLNLARNHLRDHARLSSLEGDDDDGPSIEPAAFEDPGERLDVERQRARIRGAVEQLPPRQREVVLLRIDGDLPFAEVAAALGITENNAKVCFHLGVKKLKLLLAGAAEEEAR